MADVEVNPVVFRLGQRRVPTGKRYLRVIVITHHHLVLCGKGAEARRKLRMVGEFGIDVVRAKGTGAMEEVIELCVRFFVFEDREPEGMNGQIHEILSRMTDDLSIWQSITKRFRVDLFCGLWLTGSDSGMTLSPQSLVALGERGIELGLCIYGDDEHETSA